MFLANFSFEFFKLDVSNECLVVLCLVTIEYPECEAEYYRSIEQHTG